MTPEEQERWQRAMEAMVEANAFLIAQEKKVWDTLFYEITTPHPKGSDKEKT